MLIFFIISQGNNIVKSLIEYLHIVLLIHFEYDLLPLPLFNVRVSNQLRLFSYFFLRFYRVFLSNNAFEDTTEGLFDVHLHEPELLVTFIFQNFSEQSDVVVVPQISFDPSNNGGSPFDYQSFQTVFLVEVSVHELLHCFYWQLSLSAFGIVLHLVYVDVVDHIFQLFERQYLVLVVILEPVVIIDGY